MGSRAVRTSTPVAVTRRVCSNCALRPPSAVDEVQPSGQVTSLQLPALIIGCTGKEYITQCGLSNQNSSWQIWNMKHTMSDEYFARAEANLDGESLAFLHDTHSLVGRVMRHIGCTVEQVTDPVATV